MVVPPTAPWVATFGLELLRNRSAAPVVIDEVSLRKAAHLSIGSALVMPLALGDDRDVTVGAGYGFPPSWVAKIPDWHLRKPAVTAKLDNSVTYNLVLELKAGSTGGRAAGVDVHYHQGTSHYLYSGALGVVVARSCSAADLGVG